MSQPQGPQPPGKTVPTPTPGAEGSDPAPACEFWGDREVVASIDVPIRPPKKPLAVLELMGPSPFERGGFPIIGFLATAYDKASQDALERARHAAPPLP